LTGKAGRQKKGVAAQHRERQDVRDKGEKMVREEEVKVERKRQQRKA
jgi:hypothetical protein